MGAIKEFFSSGGEFMWPILAVSVVGIAIIAERVARLFFRYSVNANQFMAQIQKLIMANRRSINRKLIRLRVNRNMTRAYTSNIRSTIYALKLP